MGLKKEIQTVYGIPCTYWIIDRIEKSKISKTAFVVLYGYPSKEIKEGGSNFLDRRFLNIYPKDYEYVLSTNALNELGANDYKCIYNFIKRHFEEFSGAEDVLEDTPSFPLNLSELPQDVDEYNDYELYGIEI